MKDSLKEVKMTEIRLDIFENPQKAIERLAEGNEMAENILNAVNCCTPFAPLYMFILDEHEIYGERINKLYEECCTSNIDVFIETMEVIGRGEITKEEIHNILN
jgi:hypothetical protein